MTIRIELGRRADDTQLIVDGENILPKLGCEMIRITGVAKLHGFTRLTLDLFIASAAIDADPQTVIEALRDEADRIEALAKG